MSLTRNLSTALRRTVSADEPERAAAKPRFSDAMPTLSSLSSLSNAARLDAAVSSGDPTGAVAPGLPSGAAASKARAICADSSPGADETASSSSVSQLPVPRGAPTVDARQGAAPIVVHGTPGEPTAVIRAGQQQASWSNPFVSHALPAILQLQRYRAAGPFDQAAIRTQLGLEVRLFRERLAASGCPWEQSRDASYLLCTYLDETVNDLAREHSQPVYDGERSLLVEFHDDAWGGEDAFSDLSRWMKADEPPVALLSFYELILSFDWRGRYRVLDRGELLLQDLRSQLHALIWHRAQPESLGTALVELPKRRRARWTPARVAACSLGALVLAYGAISLTIDSQGRPIRNALAAWMPPTRTINLAKTLPQPLPQLLTQGWLTAYKHPQGWLLVFKSDGAFDVGKASVRPQFIDNIERLGRAFAPWPGDLEVIGHTDRQPVQAGEFPDNQALSEARARMVADELRQTALPGGAHAPHNAVQRNIEYSGRGDTQPIDTARTPAAHERNRRVDVLWKVSPDGGAQHDRDVHTLQPVSSADAAVRPAMPEGVAIAPEPRPPYAATEGRHP